MPFTHTGAAHGPPQRVNPFASSWHEHEQQLSLGRLGQMSIGRAWAQLTFGRSNQRAAGRGAASLDSHLSRIVTGSAFEPPKPALASLEAVKVLTVATESVSIAVVREQAASDALGKPVNVVKSIGPASDSLLKEVDTPASVVGAATASQVGDAAQHAHAHSHGHHHLAAALLTDNANLRHTLELVLFSFAICVGVAMAALLYVYHERIFAPPAPVSGAPSGQHAPQWGQYDDHGAVWNYDDSSPGGPRHWGSLVNSTTGELLYPLCADRPDGQQSPVAIDDTSPDVIAEPGLHMLTRNYSLMVHYTLVPRPGGHPGFMIEPSPGEPRPTWTIDNVSYALLQFHYHAPSEHTINGERFALEVHFVHQDPIGGGWAIYCMLYPHEHVTEVPNPFLHGFWDQLYLPNSVLLPAQIDLEEMASDVAGSPPQLYAYPGSLTGPPCTEGAMFYVGVSKTGVNTAQKVTYEYAMQMIANTRGQQSLNGRSIHKFTI